MNKYTFVDKTGQRPVHGATNAALLGCGTFSDVYRAVQQSGKHVAIKCMKNHFDSVDHVNRLREIQALRRLSPHPNIVKLLEVLYDRSTGRLALVFELMEMNAYELVKGRKRYLADDKVLHISFQIIKGLEHMHKNGIFHRDVKPENILVNGDATKLADFGSCRGIFSKAPFTEYISTRWYRAPECLLTDGYYNSKMDVWGVGCCLFELSSLFPLFPGDNELDQIHKIHAICGTPPQEVLLKLKRNGTHMDFDFPARAGTGIAKMLPHASPDLVDLISKLLIYNADDRYTAKQALRHPYFKEIRELDKKLRRAQQQSQQPPQRNSISGEADSGSQHNLDDTKNSQQSDDEPQVKLPSIGKQPSGEHTTTSNSNNLPNLPASKTVRQQQANQQQQPQQAQLREQPSLSSVGNNASGGGGGQLPKLMPLGAKGGK